MAAKGGEFDNDLLKLIFNGTAIGNIADNASSAPLSNLYVSLHTASPLAGGDQSTNECTYTSYARVAVARTSGGWDVSLTTVTPVADISFPAATGGSETATYFGIGTASSGTGKLLYWGPLSASVVISTGIQPILTTSTIITES